MTTFGSWNVILGFNPAGHRPKSRIEHVSPPITSGPPVQNGPELTICEKKAATPPVWKSGNPKKKVDVDEPVLSQNPHQAGCLLALRWQDGDRSHLSTKRIRMKRPFTLPARLMLIVSAAILPLAAVCGVSLYALLKNQYEQTQAATLGVARAVALAVDSELRLTVSALETLAMKEAFGAADEGGLQDARALMIAVRDAHPEWRAALLATPSGAVVFNTDRPEAASAEEVVDKSSLSEVAQSSKPAVGTLTPGPAGNLGFAVRVPVVRDGSTRYVLTAIVRPSAIAAVLARQRVPEGWTVSVFDANNARIARSIDDDRLRGLGPSETLRHLLEEMAGRQEHAGTTTTVEGVRVQAAVARTQFAQWKVALGAPVAVAESARRQTLVAYGGGLIVSLCLGSFAAWWLSRSITKPMKRLLENADALDREQPILLRPSGIAEVDAAVQALTAAAAQRTQDEREREALLASERSARVIVEAAEQRLERLVSASTVLSGPLDESSVLSAIAQVIVPSVADLCRIDLLDEEGQLQRKLTHHFDPARSEHISRLVSSLSAAPTVPGSFPWAIATGQTFLMNLGDPDVPEVSDPEMRNFIMALGITAGCVVPLIARGRTIGAMAVLQADSGRRFTPEDGALIGELAQRAAVSLDNVRLLADARVTQAQAEAANSAKDDFLAMLGHELRNPLAPISLALQLIARKDATAFPRERQIIERQVKHLSTMVDDLLDVSRIVSGKVLLASEDVDLRDVVARGLELTLPALKQRQAMPEVDLPSIPVPVHGDATRLAQIVSNLLNNAAKFTAPDGRIALSLAMFNGRALLTVADEGIGISSELLPLVFERFVQGEQQLQRASGGLGLGLAIAQSLARLHGGSIQAFSEGAGKGSRFVLELPLAADAAEPPAKAETTPPPTRKMRLLLVDDNLDAVEALGSWMEIEGHEVRTATSAEEALELLSLDVPDAGIFDIGLPGMSGYELAQRVRADARTKSMVLVALSGYGRQADKLRALSSGFDDHFAKPAQVEIMLARLQELMR